MYEGIKSLVRKHLTQFGRHPQDGSDLEHRMYRWRVFFFQWTSQCLFQRSGDRGLDLQTGGKSAAVGPGNLCNIPQQYSVLWGDSLWGCSVQSVSDFLHLMGNLKCKEHIL